jgi:HSP20 family protein
MKSSLPMLNDGFREFDRMVEDLFGRDLPLVSSRSRKNASYELLQKPDCYELNLDLPGVKPEDVKLEIDGSTLKIDAERRSEERKETDTVISSNRYFGKFSHAFTLSDDVDANQVLANYDHGTLKVQLKKKMVTQPRRIEISARGTENRKLYS